MLPPKQSRPTMKNVGMYVSEDTLLRAYAISKEEKVKSRNKLLSSFLTFAVDLFPLLKPMQARIADFANSENCSEVEAIARLVERGLKAKR